MVNFEWQDGRELRSSIAEPYVSIGGGRMYFNSASTKCIGENTKWVMIGIDKQNGLVAIKPLKDKQKGALGIKPAGGQNSDYLGRNLNSKKLVSKIVGANTKTRKYEAEWSDKHDCLLIDLNKEF